MAEQSGWIPMGTVNDHEAEIIDPVPLIYLELPELLPSEYWIEKARLVLFEDELSLADALDAALHQYQPQCLLCLAV